MSDDYCSDSKDCAAAHARLAAMTKERDDAIGGRRIVSECHREAIAESIVLRAELDAARAALAELEGPLRDVLMLNPELEVWDAAEEETLAAMVKLRAALKS